MPILTKSPFEQSNSILQKTTDFVSEYYKKREECIYVESNSDRTTYDPSQQPIDVDAEWERIHDELTYLNAIFVLVWANDFEGDLSDFDYYVLTPKYKPKRYEFNFSGSGMTIKRKEEDYYHDSVKKRVGKLND